MTVLEDRLRAFSDVLDLDGTSPADDVVGRLDELTPERSGVAALRVAAAVVLVLALVVAVVPSSRRAVADWLGFDGVRIERRPLDDVPTTPHPVDREGAAGTIVDIGPDEVLVSEFVGTLDSPALSKTLGAGTDVQQVTVNGALALWIDGAPHEVSFLDADGAIVFEGFAGDTLLWQDGRVVRRLEGFTEMGAAIAYAESIGT